MKQIAMKQIAVMGISLLVMWLTIEVGVCTTSEAGTDVDRAQSHASLDSVHVIVPGAKIEWDAINFGVELRLFRPPKTEENIYKDIGLFFNERQPEQEFDRDWGYCSEPLLSGRPIALKDSIKTAGYGGLRFQYFTENLAKAMEEGRWEDSFWKQEVRIFVVKFQDLQSARSFWQNLRSEIEQIGIARSFKQDSPGGSYWEFVSPKHTVSMWTKDLWFTYIKVPLVACDKDMEKAIELRDNIKDRIFRYYRRL